MKQTTKELYAQFLLSTFGRHSALFLSELLENNPAHDSFTRWLSSTKLKPAILWEYVSRLVDRNRGFLIVDDSVLDKWYAKDIELLNFLYSGTHHKVVKGIGLVSLLWNSRHDPEHAEHLITDQPRPVLTTFLIPVLFMTPILLLLNFTIWSDTNFNKSKQAAIFITLLLSFSISMSVQRSPQNTLLLALIVIWEIYLVFKAVRHRQTEIKI